MAVAYDAVSFQQLASGGNASFTHTPVGTPRAVIIQVPIDKETADVTAVTYDGVTVPEISSSPNLKSSGELIGIQTFFLGTGINTGAVTVAATNGTANQYAIACVTLTAGADTEIIDEDATINSDSVANPSVILSLSGRESFAQVGFTSGQANPSSNSPLTNWTDRREFDFGGQTAGIYTFDTIGTSDVTAGYTSGAEDAVMIALAISEVVGGGFVPKLIM